MAGGGGGGGGGGHVFYHTRILGGELKKDIFKILGLLMQEIQELKLFSREEHFLHYRL